MPEFFDLTPPAEVRKEVVLDWGLRAAPDTLPMAQPKNRHKLVSLLIARAMRLVRATTSDIPHSMHTCRSGAFTGVFAILAVTLLATALYPHPALAQATSRSICVSCIDSRDIKNNSVSGVDIKNNSVTSADIKDGQVKRPDIAKNAITRGKIADITRSISLPATALSYQVGTNIIDPTANGLRWKRNFTGNARLTILKPADYAGGDAKLRIFFVTTTATAGAVDFFVRPDSFDAGNEFTDIRAVGAPAVLVSGAGPPGTFGKFYEQSFPVAKNRIRKDWWTINIQRQGGESTYPDDVIVMSVALEYRAVQ